MTKMCKDCKIEFPLESFNAHGNTRDRRNIYCRPCESARMRAWRARNRERLAAKSREDHLRTAYGITGAEYAEMLAQQGGACALCMREAPQQRPLNVDHDHATGAVRGLLCNTCNSALYSIETHERWADRAAAYLAVRR